MEKKSNYIEKAKKIRKWGIIAIILIVIVTTFILLQNQEIRGKLGIKTGITAKDRMTSALQSDVSKEGTPLLNDDSAIITSANVLQRKTGTAPFDEEGGDGNDVSEEDDIIRSFDQIKYTIEANMAINNTDHGSEEAKQYNSFKGGTIYVEAKIPEQHKGLMHWDTKAMIWTEGTGKVSEDNLTFTAQYKMSDDIITVPGKQTVELVLKVDGANNGLEIESPSFKLWMQGNESDEKNEDYEAITIKDNKNTVRVTTKMTDTAGYNIKFTTRNSYLENKTTVDYGIGDVEGRMYGYALILQLYNADTEKGLRGIEYPKGPITFDIDTKLEKVKDGITTDITSEATPILWNYRINENGEYPNEYKNPDYGNIADRNMYFGSNTGYSRVMTPYGRSGANVDRLHSIYNSGNVDMIQNENVLTVSIDGYSFDGVFPKYNHVYNVAPIYSENIGCFSAIYFQLFVPDTEASTDEEATYYLTVDNSNMKATTSSGEEITNQIVTNDDRIKDTHILHRKGVYTNYIMIRDLRNHTFTASGNGINKVYRGQKVQIDSRIQFNNKEDKQIKSMNRLLKFDGNALEPVLYDDGSKYKMYTGDMDLKVWYVTKQDGTNWLGQEEMNQANIEDLDIYETIDEIPEDKICVGIYFETQSINEYTIDSYMDFMVRIKDTAKIGETYGITYRTKLWSEDLDRTTQTITNPDAKYPETQYDSGNRNYIKTEYDNEGNVIKGTHNGYMNGNSILVIGAEASIEASVKDKTEDKPKTIYDLSRNENEVNFVLNPVLAECDLENPTGQTGVTVKVKDVLPKGLSYVPGSSNYGEPTTIMESEDGTTTLIWEIYNCTVGEELEPLTFKAKIAEDIATGTKLTNRAIIIPESEKVGLSHIDFRKSTYEIQVVNLASHRLYKEVNTPIIENNGIAKYTLTYQNSMNLSMPDFQLLDILPYNGDGRGSNYNGTYTIDHIEVKQTSGGTIVDNRNLNLYTTTNIEARTISPKDETIGTSGIWKAREIGATLSEAATVFAIKGEIAPNTKLEVEIYLKTQDNKAADVYANSGTAQTSKETEVITTTAVKAQVVKRQIEGMIWYDTNENGIKEEEESYARGIEVILKKSDGTPALDMNGNPVANVRTDAKGEYHFMNLPMGEYQVEIETASKYQLTQKGVGTNPSINSKFEEVNGKKQSEIITKLNQINSPEIIQSYVNAGLVLKDTKVIVKYIDQETGNEITYLDENNQEQKYSYEINGKVEEEYLAEKKKIPNYVYLSDSKNTQGKMTEDTIEVTYYYAYNKQNITAHKIWDDNNNAAQKRPSSVILTLTGNDGCQLKQVLNASNQNVDNSNQWSYTFTDLPKYTEDGEKIEYTLNEENTGSEFYTKTSVNQETRTITNQFVQSTEKVQIETTKIWDDNYNKAGKRPQSVTIQMTGNGQNYEEVITGDRNAESWSYTFELPKYDENNNEISYTIAEKETGNRFYTKENTIISQVNNIVTNRFEVPNETTQIEVTKVWDDNNNRAGKRPEAVTFVLTGSNYQSYSTELTQADESQTSPNQWKKIITDLPKYDENGNEIEYTISEENVESIFYTKENSTVNQVTKTITNRFEVPDDKQEIKVTKIWEDNNNENGKRPEEVTLYLTGNGQEYSQTLTKENTSQENENNWEYTFEELPVYDTKGDRINYILDERPVNSEFYTKTGINQVQKTVTNQFGVPTESVQVQVNKVWEDENNQVGKRPNSITLQVKNGDTIVKEETVIGNRTTNEGWSHRFEVPKYDEKGNEITYIIGEKEENTVYRNQIDQATKTITNYYETTEIRVNVVWNDNEIQAKRRPNSILVVVKNGETEVTRKEMDATNHLVTRSNNQWSYTFTGLQKYNEAGEEIAYTVDEMGKTVDDLKFYTKSISEIEDNQVTIRNIFTKPNDTTNVTITKQWDDNNNEKGKRPESIMLQVKNGETVEQEYELDVKIETEHTFTNLDKYDDNGEEIVYTAGERTINETANKDDLKFYESTVEGTTVTNQFVVPNETIDVTVKKVWNDNEIQAKRRPESILVVVKNGDTEIERQEMNGSNHLVAGTSNQWSYTFTGLQKYNEAGDEIQYSVDEMEKTEGGLKFYTKKVNKVTNKQFVITNTFSKPEEKTEVKVTKVWNDNKDAAQKRPESIKLQVKNGNTKVEEAVVTAAEQAKDNSNIWEHTFTNLEKYDVNGQEIVYTADEIEVNNGDLQFYEKGISGTTVTNTFTQSTDKTTVTVTKNWIDTESQKAKRPESIILQVKANNEVVQSKEVAVDKTVDAITETFENLAKYDENNNIINYTVDEVEKEEGDLKFYTKNISGTTITNTFTKPNEKVNVVVVKTWNDRDNTYGKRPEKIGLQVKIGDTLVEEKIVTEADKISENQWRCSFQVDPYDENGNTIHYTVGEREINPADLFYYTKTGETTQKDENGNISGMITNDMTKIPGMVEIKYIDKNTGKEIVDKVEKEGVVGESYDVTEDKKDIAGYTLVEEPEEKTGIYTKEKQEKIYYYAKNTKVVAKYLEKDTNQVLAEQIEIKGYVGAEYETEQKSIGNYTFVESSNNLKGNMTEEEITVIYYYAKNTKVKVRYLERGTNQVLAEETQINGYVGKEYQTEEKQIENYTLVDVSSNEQGTMTKEEIVVTYYYAKNTKVVVKYLEKDTNQVLAEQAQIEGYVGKEYETEPKAISGYTYVESSNNTQGNMTEEEITVIYYYLQNARAKVEHIDQDTQEILKEEIIEGKVGDVCQTKAIDIEGYILVKSPEKAEVTLEKGKEPVVKYYYQYIASGVMEKHMNQITGEVLAFKLTKGEVGDPYESKAKEFEGYDLVEIPSNSKGEMTEELIEVKYYYKRKTTLRVRYLDQKTGNELIEDQITNGHENDSYETEEKTFQNYILSKKPENATGRLQVTTNSDGTVNTETIVIYYYTATAGGVSERHIEEKTGKILEEKQHSGKIGDRYEILAKEFEGYQLNEERLPENYTGIMGKEAIEVNYYYQKIAKVRVEYIDIQTGEKLHTEEIKGKEGDHYETEAKELDGYDLVEIPSNEKGEMTEKEIVVKYYYIRKAEVEIEYREKGSNIILKEAQKIEGHVGDKYETKAEEIAYYHYKESTQNETGSMTQEKIKVIYYYEKQNFNLKVEEWVEKATVNGMSQGARNEGIYKIEINRNKVETATVKVTYKIRISNLGEIEGTVKKLSQTIPSGYRYYQEDNKIQWKEENGVLTTDLSGEMIQPGEKKEINVVLIWNPREESLGQRNSVVVLSQMENPARFEDTNKDDNAAKASIIITIATGLDRNDRIVIIGIVQIVMVITIGLLLHYKKKEQ